MTFCSKKWYAANEVFTYVPLLKRENSFTHSPPDVASRLATMLRIPSNTLFCGCTYCHSDAFELPIVVSIVTLSHIEHTEQHSCCYYDPPLIGRSIKRWCCLTSVTYIGPKSRTERPRKTNWHTGSPRHTWLGHHFQGQKVKGQGHQAALLTAG